MSARYRIVDVEQRSEAWYQARVGRVTSTCAEAILRERKRGSGPLEVRVTAAKRIAAEMLTGRPLDGLIYKPAAMQHGIETEGAARAAYEAETGVLLAEVGFVEYLGLPAGASPDGVVFDEQGAIVGGVEIKCPETLTHLEYLEAGEIPDSYRFQMIHQLWVTGAPWWDFVSFDNRLIDPALHLFRRRLSASTIDFAAYELQVRMFLNEVEQRVERLRGLAKVA